jgi:DNA-binding NarL/FixJ family response regulator
MTSEATTGTTIPPRIRLVLVDDHEIVRAGLRMLLAGYPDLEVVGEADDGATALELVAASHPDVVLMDLSMPRMDGVTATARIAADQPGTQVLVLTTFADRAHVTAAIDAGAAGYVLKDADPAALAGAIRAAARGEAPLDPRAARVLLEQRRSAGEDGAATTVPASQGIVAPPDAAPGTPGRPGPTDDSAGDLTAREREVLALVGQGMSNRLIARRLGISEKTVKAHLTRVFAQIGVTDRVQAALWWQRHVAG